VELLIVHKIVRGQQETSAGGPFFMQKYYILNEDQTAIAAYFKVLASNQCKARAPFAAKEHGHGVPYPFVSKGLQSSDHWLKGDHEEWSNLGLDDSKAQGINMDWQLADKVSRDAQPAADAQARVLLSFFFSAHTLFSFARAAVVWIAVSPFRQPPTAQGGVPGAPRRVDARSHAAPQRARVSRRSGRNDQLQPSEADHGGVRLLRGNQTLAQSRTNRRRSRRHWLVAHSLGVFLAVSASGTFVGLHQGSLLRRGRDG